MTSSKRDAETARRDVTEKLGQSLLQHGKYSDRIYLMKLSNTDYPAIIETMDALARENGYSKIVAKAPDWAKAGFFDAGYVCEAVVPRFFDGQGGVSFMSKYYNAQRAVKKDGARLGAVVVRALDTPQLTAPPELDSGFSCVLVTPEDTDRLAALYREVFETYPFPIHDPAFIKAAMQSDTVYFAVETGGSLAAAASCEMDVRGKNVEMTDFATRPQFRAMGLASALLFKMEQEMKKRGIRTAYTIARAVSYGMNITFSRQGYTYSGTLVNNTNISGSLESMNVWYKALG